MLRLSPVLTCSRPFSSPVANCGSVPRMLMSEARPSERCEVSPGRREMDSAILVSGSLPISSAETASMIRSEFCLAAMAVSMAARTPVTVMVCRDCSVDSAPVAACSCE